MIFICLLRDDKEFAFLKRSRVKSCDFRGEKKSAYSDGNISVHGVRFVKMFKCLKLSLKWRDNFNFGFLSETCLFDCDFSLRCKTAFLTVKNKE